MTKRAVFSIFFVTALCASIDFCTVVHIFHRVMHSTCKISDNFRKNKLYILVLQQRAAV